MTSRNVTFNSFILKNTLFTVEQEERSTFAKLNIKQLPEMRDNYINAFSQLGKELKDFTKASNPESNPLARVLNDNVKKAFYENGWFTEENIKRSLDGISGWLTKEDLTQWLSKYNEIQRPKNVGMILAGNIPLVGFHDLLCTVLSGHKALIKLSSQDKVLIPILLNRLVEIEPSIQNTYQFVNKLEGYDAVIATGSNNSARYFEYYFKDKPHIIRKNRNSIAVLTGQEEEEKLRELGKDIFDFYGLGCRSVSKVLIPEDYDLDILFGALFPFKDVTLNNKYSNNYDYYKAYYILNKADLIENGFLMMKEDSTLYSPVSMLFYQRYQNDKDLSEYIEFEKENIQCIVSENPQIQNAVSFGMSQKPALNDYADGVDTMEFLSGI